MKKTTLNAVVDAIAFFTFLIVAVTSIVIWLFMPSGGAFLGVARHTWATVHYDLGLLLIVLVAVHLALHWGYIKCLLGRLKRRLMRTEAPKCET